MENNVSDSNKKNNLEELTKDELIKKCKSLLVIAQKAKQTKDVVQEENNKLRQQINHKIVDNDTATREIIENLTQQKLTLVTTIEDLKVRNTALDSKLKIFEEELQNTQEKFTKVDNENISLKRQNVRLTDENEQLLTHLDSLEKQIAELNKIGIQQREQLLELEKHNNKDVNTEKELSELQKMLSVSLEEVKKLQNENKIIENNCTDMKNKYSELEKIKEDYDKLKSQYENNISDLQNTNQKLKEKLKLYHSKIVKFAGTAKALKEDKNQIIQIFRMYTEQVKEWKDQLRTAEQQFINSLTVLESEKKALIAENRLLKQNELMLREQLNDRHDNLLLEENKKLNEMEECKREIDNLRLENDELVKKIAGKDEILEKLNKTIDDLKVNSNDLNNVLLENEELKKAVKEYCNDLEKFKTENINLIQQLNELQSTVDILKKELEHSQQTERQLAEKSSEEILKLVQENKDLNAANNILQEKVDRFEQVRKNDCRTQTDDGACYQDESDEDILKVKRENAELLTEMNEMNQALKERGQTISKLEAHCEEIMKKLQIYETQANKNVDSITQKEEIIKQLNDEIEKLKTNTINDNYIEELKNEIEMLKEKLNSNLDDSEMMSTSTISRTDEMNRLKDLEGSWEERYGKLRNLALKLKAKIRELTNNQLKDQNEKEELQKKLSNSLKTIQSLQMQSDKLQDDLENSEKQCKSYTTKLNGIAEEISKDKKNLSLNEETITKLKFELEELQKEKQTTDNWKKQVSSKIQTLRKELEVKNLMKNEFESTISKLNNQLETTEQALKAEIENHKQTKSLLDQSNNECKKNSVLNLEMQDYERSVKELSQKLEKKQEHTMKLKNQIDSQKSTINALREQTKILEDRIRNHESDLTATTTEITALKKKIIGLEDTVVQKEEKIQSITQLLETARSENEELSTELSKVITEHQKTNNNLKLERDQLRSQNLGLQQTLREVQDGLRLRDDELKSVQNEYNGYKVRAQSVLRQNQNRDVGIEDKLSEEVIGLKMQNETLKRDFNEIKEKCEGLEKLNQKIKIDNQELRQKCDEFENEIEELKRQYSELENKHQKVVAEHIESVRNLKIHADTLSQCYRQQIAEQEVRHNREIIELQSKIEKSPSPSDQPPILDLPTMSREEGEGSESVESGNAANVYPVPLERLLGDDLDQEISLIKKQLSDQESKVTYLTALLSDTEQDLAKHVQMNKLLKEEIRRQQRSVEREKHAENLEYLKNVMFKFITLNSGDERTRLVPVLNTILKLSPEETQKLSMVAKGDHASLKGWTNYLPIWSTSPSKPQ